MPGLTDAHTHASGSAPGGRFYGAMYREADGPDDIRRAVREQIRAGPDFIEVMTAGARSNEEATVRSRHAFAWGYLACFCVTGLTYMLLDPHAQAALIAWASTDVVNLEHEPVAPLVFSAFLAPDRFVIWLALIAPALLGANRALGTARTALACAAGQVIGTVVSEGIVAYRVDVGQLPAASRDLVDIGPSYVVVSAIVVAVICGTWLARVAALADFAVLVFPGHIFGGLSHLDVAAVGHMTAIVTAAAVVGLISTRRRSSTSGTSGRSGRSGTSGHDVTDEDADQVGDPGGEGAQNQLP